MVDAGNLLFKKHRKAPFTTKELIGAQGILAAYAAMPYDAVALSSKDLAAGSTIINQSLADHFPWVSANVTDSNGNSIAPPYIMREMAGLSIGIIGLTGTVSPALEDFVIGDWQTALASQLVKLPATCNIVVVLSNLSEAANNTLSSEFQDVDIVITTTGRNRNLPPRIGHNTLFAQTESRGKYLGKLEIQWKPDGRWHTDPPQPLLDLRKRLSAIDIQLASLKKQETADSATSSKKHARMESYRKTIVEQIDAQETAVTDANNKQIVQNIFTSSFMPIPPTIVTNEVSEIVSKTKEKLSNSK